MGLCISRKQLNDIPMGDGGGGDDVFLDIPLSSRVGDAKLKEEIRQSLIEQQRQRDETETEDPDEDIIYVMHNGSEDLGVDGVRLTKIEVTEQGLLEMRGNSDDRKVSARLRLLDVSEIQYALELKVYNSDFTRRFGMLLLKTCLNVSSPMSKRGGFDFGEHNVETKNEKIRDSRIHHSFLKMRIVKPKRPISTSSPLTTVCASSRFEITGTEGAEEYVAVIEIPTAIELQEYSGNFQASKNRSEEVELEMCLSSGGDNDESVAILTGRIQRYVHLSKREGKAAIEVRDRTGFQQVWVHSWPEADTTPTWVCEKHAALRSHPEIVSA